jgi:hypothetical protein
MKISIKIITLLLLTTTFAIESRAQNKKAEKVANIKKEISAQQYTFIADYVTPLRGQTRQLNAGDYDLRVTKDSLIAYLPYFGQAYFDVPYNPTDGGIKFTSTKFDYHLKEKKKGGWSVQIVPQDTKNIDKIYIDISQDGFASLSVNSNNRDEISFNGYLR